MSPIDVLLSAIEVTVVNPHYHPRHGKYAKVPGAVILNMKQERRDILKQLTSAQLTDLRVDRAWLGDDAWHTEQAVNKLKHAFWART